MFSIHKIGVIGRTYRHLNRYRQILSVLFKYGFGDLLEMLKIDQYVEVGLQMISKNAAVRSEKLTRAERVRMTLEELGPTYIKLGQILSIRSDLIPQEFVQELSRLQDQVHPCPFSEIQTVVESEFKQPVEHLFATIDPTAIASASIGQVHKARLSTGEWVAVKIQRPGIRRIIEVDLEILFHLAMLAERHIEELALHRPVKIIEELSRMLEREIDYTVEASNVERFARQFIADPTIYIPEIFREVSGMRVLTMEYINGIKVSEIERLDTDGLDRKLITQRGADLFLKQVFDHGFFHADPHPGNIFVLPGNVICLLDFGMVGSIDRQTREDFIDLVESVVQKDESRAAQVLLNLTLWENEPDIRLLERDVSRFMGQHLYKPLKDIKIGRLLQDLLELASQHQLRIPPDVFFMMKAFGTIEGVAVRLDPDFDMMTRIAPFIQQLILSRLSPNRIRTNLVRISSELLRFVRQFPKDILDITRIVRQNRLLVKVEHQGFDTLLTTYERLINKLSFSMIIASLIIGSALLVISNIPPLIYGISLIGILMFFAAAVMGIWLLTAILKKGL